MTSTTFKILIIENSLIKSRKIKKFFLPKGKYQFKTYESRDLTEALKKLAKKKFNVILANPDLPNTNPLNTFSKIRFSAPNTPLILISEKNDPFLEQQAIKGGAYSFLLFGEYLRHVLPQAVRFAIEKQQAQNFLINTIEDLRQSEEGWKSLVKNVTDFVYMIDRNGKILFINRVLSDLSYDQVLNSTVFDYIDPIYHDSVRSTIEKCFESGEPGTYETIARGPQMTQSIYLSRVGPIYQNEEVESLAIISSDITEQKRLETELLNSRKLEAIGHLAGGIAHDFNNILTSILGYSSLLLENKKLDNLIKQDIKEINEDALRAAGLTKQLLAFSRKQMLQPTTINL
ncbi:MAG: PAS domain S-box protein, partial [Elusimicrobiota bacterium]